MKTLRNFGYAVFSVTIIIIATTLIGCGGGGGGGTSVSTGGRPLPPSGNTSLVRGTPSATALIEVPASATNYWVLFTVNSVAGATKYTYEVRSLPAMSVEIAQTTTTSGSFRLSLLGNVGHLVRVVQLDASNNILKSTDLSVFPRAGMPAVFELQWQRDMPSWGTVAPTMVGEPLAGPAELRHEYNQVGCPMAADGLGHFYLYTAIVGDDAVRYLWNAKWVHDGTITWASGAQLAPGQMAAWVNGVTNTSAPHSGDQGSDWVFNAKTDSTITSP